MSTKEKAVASDSMVTKTNPSPEARAFIDKLMFAYNQVGLEAILSSMPQSEEMLGHIAHCIANKKVSPEYLEPLNKIAMFIFTQIKIREMIISQTGMSKDRAKHITGVAVNADDLANAAKSSVAERHVDGVDIKHEQAIMDSGAVVQPWCEMCQKNHEITTKHALGIAIGHVLEVNSQTEQCIFQVFDGRPHESNGLHIFMSRQEISLLIEKLTSVRDSLPEQRKN